MTYLCTRKTKRGKASALGSRVQIANGVIAQLVEQRTENPCVPGSIPGDTTEKEKRRTTSLALFSFRNDVLLVVTCRGVSAIRGISSSAIPLLRTLTRRGTVPAFVLSDAWKRRLLRPSEAVALSLARRRVPRLSVHCCPKPCRVLFAWS